MGLNWQFTSGLGRVAGCREPSVEMHGAS